MCSTFNIVATFPNRIAEEVMEVVGDRELKLFEYSAGFLSASFLALLPWASLDSDGVSIQFLGMPAAERRHITGLLRKSNYLAVKGGSRETGTDIVFARATTNPERVINRLRNIRFGAGRLLVALRHYVISAEVWDSRRNRLLRYLAPKSPSSVVLDRKFGLQDVPINSLESQAAALIIESMPLKEWSLELPDDEGIEAAARLCHQRHGVYPISFCFPDSSDCPPRTRSIPTQKLSEVIPGRPYTFEDPTVYLNQYSDSYLAITHRKAGWDCFRHVEIMAGGAIPFMLDVNDIPEFSMIHYPKRGLSEVRARILSNDGVPDFDTRLKFNDYYRRHLTTNSMVRYMFSMAGFEGAEKVLFVDRNLPTMVDYQSVLTLIGVKQVFGQKAEVLHPVDYIYEGWCGDAKQLYGRGFGYTRALRESLRSEMESEPTHSLNCDDPKTWNLETFDALIFGNTFLDIDLAESVLSLFPSKKTIWIVGGDHPPRWQDAERLVASGANVFVRAIDP